MGKAKKAWTVHPGEILKTETFMEPMKITAYRLAKDLDFPGIYDVLRCKRAISAETALRLGKYFGLPAQFWSTFKQNTISVWRQKRPNWRGKPDGRLIHVLNRFIRKGLYHGQVQQCAKRFMKTTRKTPAKEIERAETCKRDYLRRHKRYVGPAAHIVEIKKLK